MMRLGQWLPSTFDHFAWDEGGYTDWSVPYFEAVPVTWDLSSTIIDMTLPDTYASQYDVILLGLYTMQDRELIDPMIDVSSYISPLYKLETATNGEFADLIAILDQTYRQLDREPPVDDGTGTTGDV